MGLSIKNARTERNVRRLARLTGESMTKAVDLAVAERIKRVKPRGSGPKDQGLADRLLAIGRRCAALPDLDRRSAKAILDDLWD